MMYLGLCVRYEPPVIGVLYKQKSTDSKKKMYTIVLNKLVFNPNPQEAARQLYLEHPHILKEDKIPVVKIAQLISRIQTQLHLNDDEEEENEDDAQEQQFQEDDYYHKKEEMPVKPNAAAQAQPTPVQQYQAETKPRRKLHKSNSKDAMNSSF